MKSEQEASLAAKRLHGHVSLTALTLLGALACSTPSGEGKDAVVGGTGGGGVGGVGPSSAAPGAVPDPSATPGQGGANAEGAAGGPAADQSTPDASSPSPGPGAGGAGPSGSAGGNSAGGTQASGGAGSGGAQPGMAGGASGGASAGAASGGSASEGGSAGSVQNPTTDAVTMTNSTYVFEHYPIETNADDVWSGAMSPSATATSTTFDTVVLENGYLRVTLLPSYGGRILSIVHKPTNRELLYQNPLGTPYLMYEDIFYYDHLVILGGIFPSFPEPEHGKYWNQPYAFEVVAESADAVTVRMSRQDDRDVAAGVPERYEVGRTDILVELEVTLRAGSSAVELDTRLTNTRSTQVPAFEYWTVTTLAPGSTPGETAIPLNTRILADMAQIHCLESSWAWFGEAEERVSGEVFRWDNLSHFENWDDQGTAFANPEYTANWSGLVNYDNDMGVLRVTAGGGTHGLKLWTFGKQSLDVDLADPTQWLRPTIEMWHGVTPEFWNRGSMAANEVREWSDRYFPTLGLREVSAANEYGAVQLSSSASGADTTLSAVATLTLPDQTVHAVFKLGGNVVAEQDVLVNPAEPLTVNASVPSSEAVAGALLEVEFSQGSALLLSGQTTL